MDQERVARIIEGVRRLRIDEGIVAPIEALTDALASRLDWKAFGTVPRLNTYYGGGGSLLSRLRHRLESRVEYRFLEDSPRQIEYLKRLESRSGPDAVELFGFLCLGHGRPSQMVEGWIGTSLTRELLDLGLMFEVQGSLHMAVGLVPYGDHYYLSDLPIVEQFGNRLGLPPAHVSPQSHWAVNWMKRMVAQRRIGSMLEMGSGIGMVLFESRSLVEQRLGVEIGSRNYTYSLVNRRVVRDNTTTLIQGDLFSDVSGKFDLIVFNPWQPTIRSLPLVERFLIDAPKFLSEGGRIALWASTDGEPESKDPVVKAIRSAAKAAGMSVNREILHSFFLQAGDTHRVGTVSSFTLGTDKGGPQMNLPTTGATKAWRLRKMIALIR